MIGDWFNAQVFQSVLRWVVDKLGLMIVANGWLTQDDTQIVTGAIVSVAVVIFGAISARTKHAAIELAGGKEAVKKAVSTNSLLNS